MKILFITKFDFTSSRKDGGLEISYRNYYLLEQIFGKENILVLIITSNKKEDTENFKYYCRKDNLYENYKTYFQLRDRISPKMEKDIIQTINDINPNFIFFDGSTFGQIVHKLNKIPSTVYFHNIERQYTWEQVKKNSILCIFRYWATVVNERRLIHYANHFICINQRDSNLLGKYYKRYAELILPATYSNRIDDEELVVKHNKEKDVGGEIHLLFIGSYFAHNYKGLIWFIKEVLPELNADLTVVGKNMEKLSNVVSSKQVKIIGTVDSLDEYYTGYDAMVMPIFMGGGMKVKTAEALMYGKTIFASKEALEGYEVEGTENIFECNSREEYIHSIKKYMNSKCRNCYNKNVRELFKEKYSTNNYVDAMKNYIENCLTNESQ